LRRVSSEGTPLVVPFLAISFDRKNSIQKQFSSLIRNEFLPLLPHHFLFFNLKIEKLKQNEHNITNFFFL
jgi:hypothetical protein